MCKMKLILHGVELVGAEKLEIILTKILNQVSDSGPNESRVSYCIPSSVFFPFNISVNIIKDIYNANQLCTCSDESRRGIVKMSI
jgi:hypothetical protein